MSLLYLNKDGLTAFWGKIKAKFVANITQNGSAITPTTDSDGFVTYDISAMPDNIATTTALASGDGIIFADSSDSNKLKRSSISFDGSTTSKCLTQKGTWQSFASGDHSHGAITNAGGITGSATAIGANDNLVFIDTSDSKKVKKSTITFDGSTTTKALTQAGTWESYPANASGLSYSNTSSGLTATDVQAAIDEVKTGIPTVINDLSNVYGSFPSKGEVLVYNGTSMVFENGWYTADASWIGYDNSNSGLSADYVGDAIDELASGKNPLIANYTSTSQSSISLSSGTTSSAFTDVANVKLTPGIWLLFGTLNFATNASGTRAGLISASSNATGANYWGTVLTGAADGMNTRIQVISIVAPTSNITYYLEAKQTSGSTLTTTGQINYLKLS